MMRKNLKYYCKPTYYIFNNRHAVHRIHLTDKRHGIVHSNVKGSIFAYLWDNFYTTRKYKKYELKFT